MQTIYWREQDWGVETFIDDEKKKGQKRGFSSYVYTKEERENRPDPVERIKSLLSVSRSLEQMKALKFEEFQDEEQ